MRMVLCITVLLGLVGCSKETGKSDGSTSAKTAGAGATAKDKAVADKKGATATLKKLSKEDCEKAARKKNIECRIKGTPEPKDVEGMIKMVVTACTSSHTAGKGGIPFQAQVMCLEHKECGAWKKCIEEKRTELKKTIK